MLTRKTFDEIVCPLEKKLDVGRNTVADRLLGSSVAKYGRLALWIGIIGEAPGHVQGHSDAWGEPGIAPTLPRIRLT